MHDLMDHLAPSCVTFPHRNTVHLYKFQLTLKTFDAVINKFAEIFGWIYIYIHTTLIPYRKQNVMSQILTCTQYVPNTYMRLNTLYIIHLSDPNTYMPVNILKKLFQHEI